MSLSTSVPSLEQKLQQHFGHSEFREGQAQAIGNAISGSDVVVLMPTGSGKSVCFQLPALELEGTTVVVSPLISLMKDQADKLRSRGISVAVMHSGIKKRELDQRTRDIAEGRVEFVYTSPERLTKPDFRDLLKRQHIDLFVVDEAHCISAWGHDFRPDYIHLKEAIADLGRPPVIALTATATPEVLADIKRQLEIPNAEIISTGFFRSNINLAVEAVSGREEKEKALLRLVRHVERPAVVYCATVKDVDDLHSLLLAQSFSAERYHGRLSGKERTTSQERFMANRNDLIIATNAFGLGVDKDNIRSVIHFTVPGSIEAYYQEFGRAGRDDQPAQAALLYDPEDVKLQRFLTSLPEAPAEDVLSAWRLIAALPESKSISLEKLYASSSLTKARVRSALGVLSDEGLVTKTGSNHYSLLAAEVSYERAELSATRSAERSKHRAWKLEQMAEYAERRICRWKLLLRYFDSSELADDTCNRCDQCALNAAN